MTFRALITSTLLLSSVNVMAKDTALLEGLLRQAPTQAKFIERDGKDVSTGIVVFGKAGELRWERQEPYQETLLANQRQAWHIDHDLNQALMLDVRTVSSWRALFDPKILKKYYSSTMRDNVVALRRLPSGDSSQWPNMDIALDPKGQLKQISFVEDDGRTIEFSGWKPAANVRFDYTPPAGMDVVGRP